MKTLRHHPRAGSHVARAIKEMVAQSRREHCLVRATLNDIVIQAAPNTSEDTLLLHFTTRMEQGTARWHQSKAYARQEAERLADIADAQDTLNLFCREEIVQDAIDAGLSQVLNLLAEVIPSMDIMGTVVDMPRIVKQLEAAGYINNDLTGNPPAYFNTPERMGRYIIGQAINCMVRGMPPHPILTNFINQYRTLCENQTQPV